MAKSFFTATRDSDLAAGSDNFSAKISASPLLYGLSVAQAAAYAAVNAAFQAAYQTSTTPSTRTKGTVAGKNSARVPLRQMASDLSKIIAGTSTVASQQKIDLGISVRATPARRPAPGTPFQFGVTLAADGSLTLTWKCDNPKGSSGTMYQVWRRAGSAGDLTYLGWTGKKRFVDSSLPAGTAQVTYQVQAVRSTAVGEWAHHDVSFGTSGGVPFSVSVGEQTPQRLAA